MNHGATVSQFESEFAQYVGARYAIACTNGTATLEVALRALGVQPGDRIATTPLTMAATSMAIVNVGAVPVYRDVGERDWLLLGTNPDCRAELFVSLYGLHADEMDYCGNVGIDDAAQTLRPHGRAAFTSYSFQRSKILNTGEGGMLVTDDEELATLARSYASLGYNLDATQSRIDSTTLKSPTHKRHVRIGQNARMNDVTAALGLQQLEHADALKADRQRCAALYRDAIAGCDWLVPQFVPQGWQHDYWCYAVAFDEGRNAFTKRIIRQNGNAEFWQLFVDEIVRHGGEMPYGAWALTYHEAPFAQYATHCPNAESLQPRLLQFQTNDLESAQRNADALSRAIRSLS